MSERTVSPGLGHFKYMPSRTIMNANPTAQASTNSGSVKRKRSPGRSDASTATLTSQLETLRGADITLEQEENSVREAKRTKLETKLEDGLSTPIASALAIRTVPVDKSCLPGEMWQYIFTFLPPFSLGRLLCLNKKFHSLLAPGSRLPASELPAQRKLCITDQEHLWSLSRRAFFPKMPRPLFSRSELRTWKLIRGDGCEFCGKANKGTLPPVATSPWAAGPGNDYVRVIWAFAVRSCSDCLRGRLQKETELLFSNSSALLPALPYAFFTPSLNYVASVTLRSEPPPTGLQLTKWFYRPQVDEMKAKLDDVMELGAATAEEWFKGLEADGREKAADASRWEHWELADGFQNIREYLAQMRHFRLTDHAMHHHFPAFQKQEPSRMVTAPLNDLPGIRPLSVQTQSWGVQAPPGTLPPKPAISMSPYKLPSRLAYVESTPNFVLPAPKSHPRIERSMNDVNEKKNARRAEIERRCAELDPPIKPSTLSLMESFTAAIKIAMYLTETAWEDLKPRLLAQREAAEQQEREQLAQNRILMQQTEERKHQEAQHKEAKEKLDLEWDDSQKTVREKLATYADSFVREEWQNGDAVTRLSCAQFAADLLVHVRHRFYESLIKEDAHMRAMGIPTSADSTQAAPSRKLTLENMRWIYESKIKPLTEHFQKELFLCHVCDDKARYFSLDSVVQHFAAKHTDSLSMGNAVVYWKADWPEIPPFDPNPTAAKASTLAAANHPPTFPTSPYMYHNPLSYRGQAAGVHANMNRTTPVALYGAQHAYQGPPHGYGSGTPAQQEAQLSRNLLPRSDQTGQRYYNQMINYTHPLPQIGGLPSRLGHHDWQHNQAPSVPLTSYQHQFLASSPLQTAEFSGRPGSALSHVSQNPPCLNVPPPVRQFPRTQPHSGARTSFSAIPPGQPMGIYQEQIQELARNAKEVFDGTSGISDLPDSVRVQVIIRHVVLRFREKYTNEPSLALFTDGLNDNSKMSPLRSLNGLSCQACASENRLSGDFDDIGERAFERRMHTLPALLAHFRSAHVENAPPFAMSPNGIEMPRPDWKFDMIEMPDPAVVRNLVHSPGITQTSFNLIANVLTSYFPLPWPQVEPGPNHVHNTRLSAESGYRTQPQDPDHPMKGTSPVELPFEATIPAMDQAQQLRLGTQDHEAHSFGYHSRDVPDQDVSKSTVAVPEHEYDPRRPAYMNPTTSERQKMLIVTPTDHPPRSEHDDGSAHGIVDDIRPQQNVAAFVENSRNGANQDYGLAPPRRALSTRSEIDGQAIFSGTAFYTERRHGWPAQDHRTASAERRASPNQEPSTAAEQFLRTFELPTDVAPEPTHLSPAPRMSQRDGYRHQRIADSSFRVRPEDHGWRSSGANARTPGYSGKSSPSDNLPSQSRYETPDHAMAEQYQDQHHDRYGGRVAEQQAIMPRSLANSPDGHTPSRARTGHLPPHLRGMRDSPSRRSNSRFGRYEAQRQESLGAQSHSPAMTPEPLAVEDPLQRSSYSINRPAGRQIFAAPPEERDPRAPYTNEIMYRRAPPVSQQIRYVNDTRYLEPVDDRYVEYVRIDPRDTQTPREYYVNPPATLDEADDFDGYEPTRPHEPVFDDDDGHLHPLAPPSDDYRDPYARQVTY